MKRFAKLALLALVAAVAPIALPARALDALGRVEWPKLEIVREVIAEANSPR